MSMNEIKYRKELSDFFQWYCLENGIEESEQEEFISSGLKASGLTFEILDDDIKTGVENGYSVEFQMSLLKKVFS